MLHRLLILSLLMFSCVSFGQVTESEAAVETDSCTIYVPNAFTPDGDHIHDGFCPHINCETEEYQFIIFDRWGEMIFETENPEECWYGVGKGGIVISSDVYVWKLKIQFEGQDKKELVGHVTLLK